MGWGKRHSSGWDEQGGGRRPCGSPGRKPGMLAKMAGSRDRHWSGCPFVEKRRRNQNSP
ncbi:hypothetical protein CLJ1_3178 [Pseudomonas paraeruginosa]|nr:hypothetical protein CLJ1_3178 [Pseudomonas aeruginosa]